MEIKNLKIKKVLKTTVVALATGTMILTSSFVVAPAKAEAIVYTQNVEVMNYFTEDVRYNVEDYLEKTPSSNNLSKLLGYYDNLYDFIYNDKRVKNTYFYYLTDYEKSDLVYLLNSWGNEIYNSYNSKNYFKTNCKDKLGFTLKYNQNNRYNYEHEETIGFFTDKQDEKLEDYLDKSNSQTNLKSALDVYYKLISFVKGNSRTNGYTFYELTFNEQEEIINLLKDWTYEIENEYSNYSYYNYTCISKIGWTVNEVNMNNELGKYMGNNNGYIIPEYPTYPTYPTYPNTQIPTSPTIPTIPAVPSVPNENTSLTVPGNNTIGKDWRANYIDPSINTSRGVRDYIPEDLNDLYNGNDWNNQNNYGYYDQYGNFIPYNNYNQFNGYNQYQDGYVEDYVPKYIP